MHHKLLIPLLLTSWAIVPGDATDTDTPDAVFASKFNVTGPARIVDADRERIRQLMQHAEDIMAQSSGESGIDLGALASRVELTQRRGSCLLGGQALDECQQDAHEGDRLRARASKGAHGAYGAINRLFTYTMQVNVGNPPSTYDLLIDTGSANIWVGARSTYKRTRTSRDTGNHVAVKYGSGSFSGEQYIDAVTITNALKMRQQPIGGAKKASGFAEAGIDGVLGLGPRTLAQGTVDNTAMVPTVVDTLYGDHAIAWPAVGVAFAPYGVHTDQRGGETTMGRVHQRAAATTQVPSLNGALQGDEGAEDDSGEYQAQAAYSTPNGALTFGGYDRTRFIGKLSWVPVTKTKPANQFWGVDQQIVYDGTVIMPQTAGILDTGTTLIYLPSDAFQKYKLAVKGAIDRDTGFLRIRNDQFKSLKPLKFALGTRTYTLSPNGQVWPRTMNAYIGGQKGYVYLMINDIGAPSGKGLDFVNGFAWSERFYSVYDTGNNGVWVADSPHGTSETN